MSKPITISTVLLFGALASFAQVGIGTETPQAMLDVHGDIRIGVVETGSAVTDSLLVVNDQRIINKVAASDVVKSTLTSFVKGTGSGSILLGLDIISGWKTIAFGSKEFDLNNDYDTSTYQFTAPKNGIYEIYAQYRTSSLLSTGNLGIGIFKQIGASAPVLIAEESYLQVGVSLIVTIEVSPPVRKTQTLVQLNAGDKIFFGSRTPIINLTLLGGPQSFFTIHQVR